VFIDSEKSVGFKEYELADYHIEGVVDLTIVDTADDKSVGVGRNEDGADQKLDNQGFPGAGILPD
jgi:hypothetical protein